MKPEDTRILFWTDIASPAFGGAEGWADRYLEGMRRRGYRIEVIADHENGAVPAGRLENGIPVHILHAGDALRNADLPATRACLQKIADLEYAFQPNLHQISMSMSLPIPLLFLMSRGLGPKSEAPGKSGPATLLTVHQEWLQFSLTSSPHERILRKADWVSCFSQSTHRLLLSHFAGHGSDLFDRSSVISHALPAIETAPLRVEKDRNEGRVVAFIGRFSHEKGADLALRAFKILRNTFSGVQMIMAGEGPERTALAALVNDLAIGDSVTFTGWLSSREVRLVLRSCDLLLVPSREESFGLIALEAAQEGCPVVATAVGGLPEVCIHGETGLLCSPENPPEMAAAAATILGDSKLSQRMSQAAQARVLASPGWEDHLNSFEEIIQRLVERPSIDDPEKEPNPMLRIVQ